MSVDFFSSFLTCIPLISFGCLVALVTTSGTELSKYGESRHTTLVPIFSGNALCFSVYGDVACGIVANCLYYDRVCSLNA